MVLPTKILVFIHICLDAHAQFLPHVSDMLERAIGDKEADVISEQYIEQKFPAKRSSCLKNALSPFLRVCLIHGVESVHPELRVRTAVHLSLCEFETSGLTEIPEECLLDLIEAQDFQECVHALQSSPQWWTTYSGNYQNLPQMCFESSLPYEKEQIIDLFLNITELYSRYQSGVENQWSDFSDALFQQGTSDLNKLSKIFESHLNHIIDVTNEHDYTLKNEFEEMQNDIKLNISKLKTFVGDNNDELSKSLQIFRQNFSRLIGDIAHSYEQALREQQVQVFRTNEMMETFNDRVFSQQCQMVKDMDIFFDEMRSASITSVSDAKYDLEAILNDNFNLLKEFQDVMQTSIITPMKNELIPQIDSLSTSILQNMMCINSSLSFHFNHLMSQVDSSYEELGEKTNRSLKSLKEMESSIHELNRTLHISLKGLTKLLSFFTILVKTPSIIPWMISLLSMKFVHVNTYRYPVAILTVAIAGSKLGASLYRELFADK